MASKRYVALLRGINVGGRNPVRMAALRDAMEAAGYEDVRTHLQSGNVLFASAAAKRSLEGDLERVVESRFGFPVVVVVRSHQELRAVVEQAPARFGAEPDTYHSDAIFLKAPLTARRAMKVVERREDVDQAWPGAACCTSPASAPNGRRAGWARSSAPRSTG